MNANHNAQIGRVLKSTRALNEINTQAEFASLVEAHQNSVSTWENGTIPRSWRNLALYLKMRGVRDELVDLLASDREVINNA